MRAIVTGASKGIGRSISLELAKRGYDLTLVARTRSQLENLQSEISTISNVATKIVVADLSKIEEVGEFIRSESQEEYHLVINNAGFGSNEVFWRSELKFLNRMIDLNVKALVDITYSFINSMISHGIEGKIINVASMAAFPKGFPGMSVYASSKKFVHGFSMSVDQELKYMNKKPRVISVLPGVIDTNFYSNVNLSPENQKALGKSMTGADQFAVKVLEKILDKNKTVVVYGKMSMALRVASVILPRKLIGMMLLKKGF